MKAIRLLVPVALILVFAGCSLDDPYEPDPEVSYENLSVPGDYASISEAIAAAATWDTIRVAPGRYEESFTLPPDVLLFGAAADRCSIIGQVTIEDSSIETRFEGVYVSNATGSGLLLVDASPQVSHCIFEESQDAGIEIVGNSAAEIFGCLIYNNGRGILLRDADQAGHYWDFDHLDGTAPKVSGSNLYDNGGIAEEAINIVFENTLAPDTLGVNDNYWGIVPVGSDPVNLTIFDDKDGPPHINGWADTDNCVFKPMPHDPLDWQWDD